jgi:hypothetical protein
MYFHVAALFVYYIILFRVYQAFWNGGGGIPWPGTEGFAGKKIDFRNNL